MKARLRILFALQLVAVIADGHIFAAQADQPLRPVDYVRPMVGTKGEGNTFPGPAAPFGMVQFSPDTDRDLWDTASGYEYTDTSIMGFSLTHLSGTGIPDLGDFLFIPQIGKPKLVVGSKEHPELGYRAKYRHEDESASAGYYKVKLLDRDVTVELTAAERAGMMRFTFPASDEASIMTDMQHFLSGKRFKLIWSHVRVEDDSTITGYHLINGWGKERHLYFAARYSHPSIASVSWAMDARSSTTVTRVIASAAVARRQGQTYSFSPSTRQRPASRFQSRRQFPPSARQTHCRIWTRRFRPRIGISRR